jgi:hypothetical protein
VSNDGIMLMMRVGAKALSPTLLLHG